MGLGIFMFTLDGSIVNVALPTLVNAFGTTFATVRPKLFQATPLLVDGRMYVVACWRPNDDPSVAKYSGAIKLVQAYVSTMHLLPDGPASAAPTSPGPS